MTQKNETHVDQQSFLFILIFWRLELLQYF